MYILPFGYFDDGGNAVGAESAGELLLKTANSFRDCVRPNPAGYFAAAPAQSAGKEMIEISVERKEAFPIA
jgi:hypothetical protein